MLGCTAAYTCWLPASVSSPCFQLHGGLSVVLYVQAITRAIPIPHPGGPMEQCGVGPELTRILGLMPAQPSGGEHPAFTGSSGNDA